MSELVTHTDDTDPYEIFRRESDGYVDYAAGFPGYTENFSRDAFMAGVIGGKVDILSTQLRASAHHQGTRHNTETGEQPGRIHHQMPGVGLEGREGLTTYNAHDTTPLFLIGHEALQLFDPDEFEAWISGNVEGVNSAVDHIISCVGEHDNLYWEEPPEGGDGFALKVTYWKDSILPHADGKQEPMYPVAFALTQFIAARSLLSAAQLLQKPDLAEKADAMLRTGIRKFMRPDSFLVYEDAKDELAQTSSDELHALAYIPEEYADLLPLEAIRQRAQDLETPYGYMCTPPSVAQHLDDNYHGNVVWIIDQAMIHYGAEKFGLEEVANTAANVASHIHEGQELLGVVDNPDGTISAIPEGFPKMLWSRAAAEYFAGRSLSPSDDTFL